MKNITRCMIAAFFVMFAFQAQATCTVRRVEVPKDGGEVFLRNPGCIQARVLAANVAESVTVPTGANFVVFEPGCAFYANYTTTAAIPAADVTDGSGSDYSPTQRFITGVTTISLIADSACVVSLAFFGT